jgi:hypothetical protein
MLATAAGPNRRLEDKLPLQTAAGGWAFIRHFEWQLEPGPRARH